MPHRPYDTIQPLLKTLEGLIYRYSPDPEKFEYGITWKDSAIEADEILSMIAEALKALGCCHGHDHDKSTPPMMYPEWIGCVVVKRNKEIKALQDEVAKLTAIIQKNDLCHNRHGLVDAQAFADGCAVEQRKEFGCAPDRDHLNYLLAAITAIRNAYERGHPSQEIKERIDYALSYNPGESQGSSQSSISDDPGLGKSD